MLTRRWIFALLIVSLILAGCRNTPEVTAENLQIDLVINPDPPTVGEGTLSITLTDGDGNPVNDATLSIEGNMNHAGMVPVLRETEDGAEGVYEVPFEWTMGGDWFVVVNVTLPNGDTASETFEDVTVSSDRMDMDDMDMEGTDEPHDMDDMDMEGTDEPHDHDMDAMGGGETSAAYMTITNNGDEADTLVEVQAEFANVTELHETMIEDDVARMEMVGEFEIPAGESVELAPAGKHVMLMDLQSDLVMDDSVELTLIFESGAEVTVTATIQDMLMNDDDTTFEAGDLVISGVWVRPASAGGE